MGINCEALSAPFDPADVEFKPQAFSKDKTKALAIAYVDPRKYQERLSDVVGDGNWSVEYRPLGDRALIARITINTPDGTIVREDVGEFSDDGKALYPTASAQAFKRACVTMGLGRYLYDLPQTWVAVENNRITDAEINRLRSQISKTAPKPAPRPQANPAPVQGRPVANGAQGVQTAKAISRISELVGQAKDIGVDVELPPQWQTLPYDEMIALGKKVAQVIEEES